MKKEGKWAKLPFLITLIGGIGIALKILLSKAVSPPFDYFKSHPLLLQIGMIFFLLISLFGIVLSFIFKRSANRLRKEAFFEGFMFIIGVHFIFLAFNRKDSKDFDLLIILVGLFFTIGLVPLISTIIGWFVKEKEVFLVEEGSLPPKTEEEIIDMMFSTIHLEENMRLFYSKDRTKVIKIFLNDLGSYSVNGIKLSIATKEEQKTCQVYGWWEPDINIKNNSYYGSSIEAFNDIEYLIKDYLEMKEV